MSGTIYYSTNLAEGFIRPEPPHVSFAKMLGSRAVHAVSSTRGYIAERKAAVTAWWHDIRQPPPENDWQAVQAAARAQQSATDLAMLDIMLAEPYEAPPLERAEYYFVNSIAASCETVAAAGRLAGRALISIT